MSLCLASAGLGLAIAASEFTLSWTHTIEKTTWRESWRAEGERLHLIEASVQGSGAGMEPPPESRLLDGAYVWRPSVPPLPELVLRRAPEAGDWTLCAAGRCAALGAWMPGAGDPVILRVCHASPGLRGPAGGRQSPSGASSGRPRGKGAGSEGGGGTPLPRGEGGHGVTG